LKALILEDDDLIAELLETVVAGLYSGVSVVLAETLGEALIQVKNNRFDLYIADRNLPDGSGLELVRQVRQLDRDVPIVMVSGRSDRESVLQAAHYGIDGYMTKPFDVANLHERLGKLLKVDQTSETPDLETLLRDSLEEVIQLPSDVDPSDILELIGRQGDLSAAQLAERWREEASLTARLLDVANSSSFRRSGKPVETLRDAIGSLGVPLALNQALALSLDVSSKLQHEPLRELAKAHTKPLYRWLKRPSDWRSGSRNNPFCSKKPDYSAVWANSLFSRYSTSMLQREERSKRQQGRRPWRTGPRLMETGSRFSGDCPWVSGS